MILQNFSNYAAFISSVTLPNKEFWLLFSILTLINLPIWLSLPSKITEFKNLFLPKNLFWFLSLFSTSTSRVLPSKDLFNSIWLLNNFSCIVISLFLSLSLSVISNSAAFVPGLGLKINENEFINLILLTKFMVSLKSFSVSPGYPIIKSLENFMSGLILFKYLWKINQN